MLREADEEKSAPMKGIGIEARSTDGLAMELKGAGGVRSVVLLKA